MGLRLAVSSGLPVSPLTGASPVRALRSPERLVGEQTCSRAEGGPGGPSKAWPIGTKCRKDLKSWVWEGLGAPGGKTVLGACGGTASQHSYASKFQLGKPQAKSLSSFPKADFPLVPLGWQQVWLPSQTCWALPGLYTCVFTAGGLGVAGTSYSGDVPGPLSYTPK